MKPKKVKEYNFLIIPIFFIFLIFIEVNVVNDYLNIEKWKYFIWQGENRGLNAIIVWNAVSLVFISLYFYKSIYYERYIAPLVSLLLFSILIVSPFIFGDKVKNLLANSATFKNEGVLYLDFTTNVLSAKCIHDSSSESYCENYNSLIFPYGNTAIIFKFVPSQFIEFIALILNISTLVILVYVVVKSLGISSAPIFLSSPWVYFALERANADLYLLIILLLGSYFPMKKYQVLYWVSYFYMVTLKPIYAGYLLGTKISIKNIIILILGIIFILGSYNFSLESLSSNRAKVNPTPFGSLGFTDAIELVDIIFQNNNITAYFLIFIFVILFILYIDKNKPLSIAALEGNGDFVSRNMFLILVIIVVGNQVNYKLILLIPLLIIALNKSNTNVLATTILGLITIGQHTIIRNIFTLVLAILIINYLIDDFRYRINNRVKVDLN